MIVQKKLARAVTTATDYQVADRAVKLAEPNATRHVLNIWAGDADLWIGEQSVKSGTVANRIAAGTMLSLEISGELWAVRETAAGLVTCGVSEEIG